VPSEVAGSASLYSCELALVEDPLHAGLPSATVLDFNGDITGVASLNVNVRLHLDYQPLKEQICDQN
jgi:hypothetical protein